MDERRRFNEQASGVARRLGHQDSDYLDVHAERLFETWRVCTAQLRPGAAILSIGAGSAFVENALQSAGFQVTVVDFPEAIRLNAEYYAAAGMTAVGADVSDGAVFDELGTFDAVLAAEIVEHIPAAPAHAFTTWAGRLAPGGRLIVTTPNLGSISALLRIAFMRPLLADPELTFGAVSFENEGVHRREYMPAEIRSAMRQAGLEPVFIAYCRNHRVRNARDALYVPFYALPRFRPTMIVVGAKA